MGGIRKKYFLDRLLQMPEAADLVAKDIASHRSRCISDELRNGMKPKSERVPVPIITERTFERLAFLEALYNDVAIRERQSKKGRVPKKNFSIEEIYALLDIWADRMLRDGIKPDQRGWKKYVFMSLNLSAWSVVAPRLKQLGVTEADLVRRMQEHQSHVKPRKT